MIDVVIPYWNQPSWLGQSIFSIISQDIDDEVTLHVIDDGSKTNLNPVKFYFRDYKNIKWYTHRKRQGLKEVVRKGIRKSTGNFIAFQSATDIAVPTRLKQAILTLQHLNCDAFGCFMRLFGNSAGIMEVSPDRIPLNTLVCRKVAFKHPVKVLIGEVPLIFRRVWHDKDRYWSGHDKFVRYDVPEE